jgi:N-acetylglucosamine kinase-like BadF-type ATPase
LGSDPVKTFLGVDGGGTKTDFLLIDETGRELAATRAGSAYYPEIGVDALKAMLEQGIREISAQAAVPVQELSFACIGLPAYGEDSALLDRLDQLIAGIVPTSRYRCVNDMVCGWAAALGGRDGINVIAGTGSIGYGEYKGRCARAGGWGELFSDEGSAYWMAREGLALFSRMSDGRAERGPLYELLRAHFGLRADIDVCAKVYGPPAMPRSELAALAPIVAQAVRAGDGQATRLYERAAEELSGIVYALRGQLAVPVGVALAVSYSGGMFRLDHVLTWMLETSLRRSGQPYEFSAPRLTPRAGAALYAAKLSGAPLGADAVARLAAAHGAVPEEAK